MTGELLTVKEYAARQGMTEQAAYKQIRAGKLLTVERQEGGKVKKYVFWEDGPAAAAAGAGQIQAGSPEDLPQEPGESVKNEHIPPAQPESAALEQAVAALTAQLAEKDKQIAEKDRQITEKDKQITEKDKQIERFTELLSQSHQLQAHTQKMLEQGAPQPEQDAAPQDAPTADAEGTAARQGAQEAPKKKGFFAWLFGE